MAGTVRRPSPWQWWIVTLWTVSEGETMPQELTFTILFQPPIKGHGPDAP